MSIDSAHQEHKRLGTGNAQPVTTVGVSASALLCIGLEQLLSDTRFALWKRAVRDVSELPGFPDSSSLLFVVDGKHHPDETAELIRTLKARYPSARVVVLADQFAFGAVMSARHAGADGFCLTSISRDALIHSLELVMLGEIIVPSALVLAIMGEVSHEAEGPLLSSAPGIDGFTPQIRRLSSRETEILCWLKEGAPNKVIARKLNLTEATVKVHVKAILRKIGVGNRTQAAIWAADHLSAEAAAVQ
jgi:two-component system, NarL family, nitrate/nitrite response regulator NarL